MRVRVLLLLTLVAGVLGCVLARADQFIAARVDESHDGDPDKVDHHGNHDEQRRPAVRRNRGGGDRDRRDQREESEKDHGRNATHASKPPLVA